MLVTMVMEAVSLLRCRDNALDRIGRGIERKRPVAARAEEAGANPLLQFLATLRSKPLKHWGHAPSRC